MNVSRRRFLRNGLSVAGICLGWEHLSAIAARAATLAPRLAGSSKILVVIQLTGGNDGINTLIPYTANAYYKLRPTLAIKQEKVLQLNDNVALHPNMSAMSDLFKAGKLAVIAGAGYPNPNRSHFRSIEIWQTAEPERIAATGWLGRYLDECSSSKTSHENLFTAINVDPELPKSLTAEKVLVPSVSNVNQFRFIADQHYEKDRLCQLESFKRIYSSLDTDRPDIKLLRDTGLDAMEASDYLARAVKEYKGNVEYPNNNLARNLKFIAQLITAGVDARIYNLSFGGFDTHANQLGTQGNLLKQLSDSISAFQKDLEEHNVDKDVVLMTFSEFGRRVAQNNGNGTDHGTAGPVFVVGSSVKSGVYGDYPSMTDLDSGDLKYSVDFRCIYSTILERWLSADSRRILGGHFDQLGFV
jgi:uncharacterized protein (DUF1501 family)